MRTKRISKRKSGSRGMFGGAVGYRRVTSKGQVTIPNVIRKLFNITSHSKLEFILQQGSIIVRPVA